MTKKQPNPKQLSLFSDGQSVEIEDLNRPKSGYTLPLDSDESLLEQEFKKRPEIPARWEAAQLAAERKNVLPSLLAQIRRVKAMDYLEYLISLSSDEGYVWVVHGESGSGKSAFFHTLENQTGGQIKKHIIDGNKLELSDQKNFSRYLNKVITDHKAKNGATSPLVIILEERESSMTTEERSSIAQALRNVLRPPGPGSNVVFVLPVTNTHNGTLFVEQVKGTGVAIPVHNAVYTFQGPPYTEHVDIFTSLFMTLNDEDISDYGLQRSDLQANVSEQQTIGQYIRSIRAKLEEHSNRAFQVIRSHSYRPFTVIICYINPLPGYVTEPIIKAMTINPIGRVRTGEILNATAGQGAQKWQSKRQAFANIIEALDLRIVEIPPYIIVKLLYGYGWQKPSVEEYDHDALTIVERYLEEEGIDYNAPKNVRQNLRQQLAVTNLFRVIIGKETERYVTPRPAIRERDTKEKQKEEAELAITKRACEISSSHQHTFHQMFAQALEDLFQNSTNISSLSDFKGVYPEANITLSDKGTPRTVLRTDIAIEMQDKLFLLEFAWRSAEHFTYANIATYDVPPV